MIFIVILFLSFSVACVIFASNQYKKNQAMEKQLESASKHILAIEREIKALLSADIVFGRSVTNLKAQLSALDDKQGMLENRRSNDGGYQHALKLLEMGSSVEDIIKDCNLTSAEAELLANIQAYQAATSS